MFLIMLYIGLQCDELINISKPKVTQGLAHFLLKDLAILLSHGLHPQQGMQVRKELRNRQSHFLFQMLEEHIHGSNAEAKQAPKLLNSPALIQCLGQGSS